MSHDCLLSLADFRRLFDAEDHPETCCGDMSTFSRTVETSAGYGDTDTDTVYVDTSTETTSSVTRDALIPTSNDGASSTSTNNVVTTVDDQKEVVLLDTDLLSPDQLDRKKLAEEQKTDETLSGAFELARESKGGYFAKNDLLYHHTQLRGHAVERLVVPKVRRTTLLDLAHSHVG